MLALLCGVGDKACLSRFLDEVMLSHYTGGENEDLPAALKLVGPKAAGRFLLALVEAHFSQRPKETLDLLRRLREERSKSAGRAWNDALRDGVRSALRTVSVAPVAGRRKARTARAPAGKSPSTASRPAGAAVDPAGTDTRRLKQLPDQAVRDLFALAWHWRLMSEANAAAGAIAASSRLASPDRALPAALGELHAEKGLSDTTAFATLWRHSAGSLLERSARPPKEPRHWKIAADIDCKCDLCADLRAFCKDPAAQVARFPLARGAARPSAPDHRVQQARHRPRDRAPGKSLHPRVHQEPGEPQAPARRVLQGRLADAPADPLRTGQGAERRMCAGSGATAGGGGGIRAEVKEDRQCSDGVTAHPCWLLVRLRSCSDPWIPAFAGMTSNRPDALIRHSREGGNPVTLLQPADDEGE